MAFNCLMSPTKAHRLEYSTISYFSEGWYRYEREPEKKSKEKETENSKETADLA